MDWMAVFAVLIALVTCFGEMLSKHETKVISDILNRYLLIYLLINGLFAYAAYYFLPSIAEFVLKPEHVAHVQGDSWGRVFFAAFGYMALVRTKIATIKDTPFGMDLLYNTFSSYCLRHTNILIQNRLNKDLEEVVQKYPEVKKYSVVLEDRLNNAPESDRETIRTQKEIILGSKLPEYIQCKRLGELILRIVGTRPELEKSLSNVPSGED